LTALSRSRIAFGKVVILWEKEEFDMSEKEMDFEKLEPHDRMKYEIAEELGLLDKVREGGWKALSSKETGRIGGMMSRRRKALGK